MANTNQLQITGTINRVFAAYFINQCYFKDDIKLVEYKPEAPLITIMNAENTYYTQTDNPHYLKHFFHGRLAFQEFYPEKFAELGIVGFFDQPMKDGIDNIVTDFTGQLKANQYCDLVFSSLPEAVPFLYDCIFDPDTNFRSRLIVGTDFATGKSQAIWEFYALMMHKLREVEPHVIYGKTYKPVDDMTDEEKQKYFINNRE